MRLCVIPARGGSKRIPRKNIRPFCGLPMIAWSIRAALDCGHFDAVLVSTDDAEIAAIAREYGASTPFQRPPELANDYVGTGAVVQHAIAWHIEQGVQLDEVCCLYATAPFVQAADLSAAFALLADSGKDSAAGSDTCFVFTATSFPFPILRALQRDAHGGVAPMFPEHIAKRSQDLAEAFHDAGQFYLGDARHWLANLPMFGPRSRMLLLPRHRVQDIDNAEDWQRAEWLFRAMQAEGYAASQAQ